MRYWVLGKDNQPKGPYEGSHILDGIAKGKVDPARKICREGEDTWLSIRDVAELNGSPAPDFNAMEEIGLQVDESSARPAAAVMRSAPPTRAGPTMMRHPPTSAPMTKTQRVSMINRRCAAWLLEYAALNIVVHVLVYGLSQARFSAATVVDEAMVAQWVLLMMALNAVAYAAWLGLRDLVPGLAWGRRWLQIEVVSDERAPQPASAGARVGRSIILIVPLLLIVEYFVAYYSPQAMRRLGDRMFGTRVIDLDPSVRGTKSHSLHVLLAVVANVGINILGVFI